jgi:zinc-finger of transposase IS204/IS1001/IS1096/IS1165
MSDVDELVRTVFSGLSPLVIEDVADQGERILIRARTPAGMVACPGCGALTERVHGYHERVVADVPVDARRVQRASKTRLRSRSKPARPYIWRLLPSLRVPISPTTSITII